MHIRWSCDLMLNCKTYSQCSQWSTRCLMDLQNLYKCCSSYAIDPPGTVPHRAPTTPPSPWRKKPQTQSLCSRLRAQRSVLHHHRLIAPGQRSHFQAASIHLPFERKWFQSLIFNHSRSQERKVTRDRPSPSQTRRLKLEPQHAVCFNYRFKSKVASFIAAGLFNLEREKRARR